MPRPRRKTGNPSKTVVPDRRTGDEQVGHTPGVVVTDPAGRSKIVAFSELGATGIGDVVGPVGATDNAIARFDGTTGKRIQNSQPVIPDDGRITLVTDPVDDQDAVTKHYLLSVVAPPANSSFLVSGGQVIWQSGFTFLVSAATYYIQGVLYSSPQETVVLDAADGTFDRIDVIVVNTSGHADKVTGTPSSTPSEPDIDPTTQLQLAIVIVPAGGTQPVISTLLLYAENTGSPTEWDWTSSSGTIVLNSTSNPRNGTKDIEGTAVVQNAFVQGTIGSGNVDPTNYDHFVFYVRSKASWPNTRTFSIRFYTGTVAVGAAVNVSNGQFGFDSAITGSYQQVAIPLSLFALPGGTLITRVRITRTGSGTNGWYIDDMSLVLMDTPAGDFLTQAQADARYAPLVHHERHEPDGADALGERFTVRVATTGNITISTALNAGDTLDGKTLVDGDLALVKDQSTAAQNGIYVVGATPVRAHQFNSYNEHPGVLITVQEGTTNADTKWLCTSDKGGTLDTTAIVFAADTGGGGSSLPVVDTTAIVKGSGDATKLVRIEADTNVPTATTVVVTAPAADVSLAPNVTYAAATHVSRHQSGGADPLVITLPITFIITNGGSVLTTGLKGEIRIPMACTIVDWAILLDQSGSIQFDIWKTAYSAYDPPTHPAVGDSITASAKPLVSSAKKNQSSTLTGWTTSVAANDVLAVNIDSVSTATRALLQLKVTLNP